MALFHQFTHEPIATLACSGRGLIQTRGTNQRAAILRNGFLRREWMAKFKGKEGKFWTPAAELRNRHGCATVIQSPLTLTCGLPSLWRCGG